MFDQVKYTIKKSSFPRAVWSFVSDTKEIQRLHNKAFHTQRLQLFLSVSAADNDTHRYWRFVHHVFSSTLYTHRYNYSSLRSVVHFEYLQCLEVC